MENFDFLKFVLAKLDNTTAWIGLIGMVLFILHFHTALFFLFAILFFVPEARFSEWFRKATAKLRSFDHD